MLFRIKEAFTGRVRVYKPGLVSGFILLGLLAGCSESYTSSNAYVFNGQFWKKQAINDIISAWSREARDTVNGGFYSHLNRQWIPYNTGKKYPGMLARHIFSYSAAYMMSGKSHHIEMARKTMNYLIKHGWDEKYGLWYNSVDSAGNPVNKKKDLFMQTYAITGLAMYYIATHDSTALHYLKRSNQLLEKHAWDSKYGGYVRTLNRDLSVANYHKEFTPQLAPISGHLLYLFAATRDTTYLKQARRIFDKALKHMFAGPQKWILERFKRDWTYMPEDKKNRAMNVGHNIETAWVGLRMYELTSDRKYLKVALRLADSLNAYAFGENGAWYHRIDVEDPHSHSDTTPWWIQAYGNMTQLYLFRQTGANRYLNQFKQGAQFWNRHFVDDKYGGTVLSTYLNGRIHRGDKAVRSKTSYHAVEHAFLNYIYLNLWVENDEVRLHYHINEAKEGEKLYPLPIEDFTYKIDEVTLNGNKWNRINRERGYIILPEGTDLRLTVGLRN